MPSLRPARVALVVVLALIWPLAWAGPASAGSRATEVVHVVLDDTGARLVLTDLTSRRSTTLLQSEDGLFLEPELSPDGGTVAFVLAELTDVAFTFAVATVERDGGGLRRLTSPPSTDSLDVSPRWSPDGSRLMFARITVPQDQTADAHGDLLAVPRLGGSPVELVEGAVGGDWSPDGGSAVVLDGPLAIDASDAPLSRVELTSGTRSPLGARGFSPAWSPDGTTIAYVAARDTELGSSQLATVPATGGAPTSLTRTAPAGDGAVDAPSWSPDSGSLVYTVMEGGGGDTALWATDRDGARTGRVFAGDADSYTLYGSISGPAPSAVSGRSPAAFTAVVPQRLLDTREGSGVRVGAGGTVDVPVVGVHTSRGVVPATATAVVLNVTVTGGTASTDVRAYPAGSAVPEVSNLNAAAHTTVPNLVTVPLGSDGAVTLRNNAGSVHLVADLAGWYAPHSGDGFAPVAPGRLLDTRQNAGQPVGHGGVLDLRVTGDLVTGDGATVTVPADASAVVLNVTGTGGTAPSTDVRAYPAATDAAVPETSNLNLSRGQTAASLVVVAVGDGGRVRLRNASGQLHLLTDIVGYYAPSAPGRFVAAEPVRLLDTRDATGAAPLPLLGGAVLDLSLAGARGIPAGATAAVVNLTATTVTASTDVRSYPTASDGAVPTVSTLNVTRGATRANAAVVQTGESGRVRLRNNSGSAHLIADLAGWFQPAA